MTKAEDRAVGPHHSDRLGRFERVLRQLELSDRPPDRPELVRVRCRGHEHRGARGARQALDALHEDRAQACAERQRVRERLPPGQLCIGKRAGKLEECQRVAAGIGDQPLTHRGMELAHAAIEQLRGRPAVKPAERLLVESRRLKPRRLAVPSPEQDHDPLRQKPARREDQGISRRRIQPLSVIDHTEGRPGLGGGCQERKHTCRHQKAIGSFAGCQPEGGREGCALRLRQSMELIQDWAQQGVQAGVRQVGLRFQTRGTQDRHRGRLFDGMGEQRRLAHPRFAPKHQ